MGGQPRAVVELLEQIEGLLAVGKGLLVLAEEGVVPADRVERGGVPAPVTGGPVQVESLPGVVECLSEALVPRAVEGGSGRQR